MPCDNSAVSIVICYDYTLISGLSKSIDVSVFGRNEKIRSPRIEWALTYDNTTRERGPWYPIKTLSNPIKKSTTDNWTWVNGKIKSIESINIILLLSILCSHETLEVVIITVFLV